MAVVAEVISEGKVAVFAEVMSEGKVAVIGVVSLPSFGLFAAGILSEEIGYPDVERKQGLGRRLRRRIKLSQVKSV